jgi:hypothetical protein
MSAADTKALIATAVERLLDAVPALRQLKLTIRLQLEAKGGDAPIWRVELPGPKIDRDPAGDARLDVTVQRQHFNRLAEEGTLTEWARAYEKGHIKVAGDPGIVKLLGSVIAKQLARQH